MRVKAQTVEIGFIALLFCVIVTVCATHFSSAWRVLAYIALAGCAIWFFEGRHETRWHRWLWIGVGLIALIVFAKTPGHFG